MEILLFVLYFLGGAFMWCAAAHDGVDMRDPATIVGIACWPLAILLAVTLNAVDYLRRYK